MEIRLPDLRIVPLRRLIRHEELDPTRVSGIVDRLKGDGVLGNPPIVGEVEGTNRLIVLDGANRVSGAMAMKFPAFLVQVVDYASPEIRLARWHHLLLNFDADHLVAALRKIPGASVRPVKSGTEASVRGRNACLIHLTRGDNYLLKPDPGVSPVRVLRGVTDIYKRKTRIYRIADEQIDMLTDRTHENVTAVILFPCFKKEDIVRFALHDREKLPPGITKHFIPNRALKVNLPLRILRAPMSLKERNRKLEAWIAAKVRDKKVRAYAEPTVIFDE